MEGCWGTRSANGFAANPTPVPAPFPGESQRRGGGWEPGLRVSRGQEDPIQKGPSCSSSPALPLRAAAKTDRLSFSSAAKRFPLSQKTGSEIRGNASRGGLGLAAVKVVVGCPHPPISNFSHACAEQTTGVYVNGLACGCDHPRGHLFRPCVRVATVGFAERLG